MSNKSFSRMFQRWLAGARRPVTKSARSRKAQLRVEEVEQRVVPATPLPAPTVTETQAIADQFAGTRGFSAQAAIDPTNPQRMVVVRATGPVVRIGTDAEGVFGQFTLDGGSHWTTFTDAASGAAIPASTNIVDPLIFTTAPPGDLYQFMSDPSVAYGRDGTIYLSYLVHNAAYNSGAVMARTFHFDPANGPQPLGPATVLYRWLDPTNSGRDQAFNPTVAVDNNLPRFIDPTTGEVSTDTLVDKAAYVTWNMNSPRPDLLTDTSLLINTPTPFNPNPIFVAATSDRGANWTTPVPVNDSLGLTVGFGAASPLRNGGFFSASAAPQTLPHLAPAAAPHIVFSPPEVNPNATVTPGQMKFVWSTTENQRADQQFVRQDTSQPDGGILGQQVASAASFTNFGGALADAIVNPAGGPDTPSPNPFTIPVSVPANFGTITDVNVSLAMIAPHMNHFQILVIPPPGSGLPTIALLQNRTLPDGTDRLPTITNPITVIPGLPDGQPDLGVFTLNNQKMAFDATFDQEASRIITDPTFNNSTPYITSVRPEGGIFGGTPSLASYYGATPAQITGTWTVQFIDNRNDRSTPPPFQILDHVTLHFSGIIDNNISNSGTRFGADATVSAPLSTITPLRSGPGTVQPTITNASPNIGVSPSVSLAYDTSQGSASPYSGRLYMVYTGLPTPFSVPPTAAQQNNTQIYLTYSDRNGLPNPNGTTSWSDPIVVNDDSIFDQFTEGNRAHFQPSVTVDPITGTVVVTWYDARNDASNARLARYIATSTDGGRTFTINNGTSNDLSSGGELTSPQTFLDTPKQAIDAITRDTVTLEPTPSNLAASESANAPPLGFGLSQSVIAYDGRINPFWTGNLNATGRNIFTATVRVASGPRIVDSDMGSATANASITDATGAVSTFRDRVTNAPIDPLGRGTTKAVYNNTFAADGTRRIDGFKIVFDRPIDVTTFTAADITVLYRSPRTPLSDPATVVPVLDPVPVFVSATTTDTNQAVIPGDPFTTAGGQILATTFFVPFATPQDKVGTYSYQVGPYVRDRIWNPQNVTPIALQPDPTTSPNLPAAYQQFAQPFVAGDIPAGGTPIPNPPPNGPGGSATSTIAVVGSSRVDLQACKLEYSIVSPK